MSRIKLQDNAITAMMKMADGNPGAATALMETIQSKADVDSAFGGFGSILNLDSLEIYGTDIYVLWSDICKKNTVHMIAVLRATQLGLFSRNVLKDACSRQDYSGASMIPVQELYNKVRKELPNFDSEDFTNKNKKD